MYALSRDDSESVAWYLQVCPLRAACRETVSALGGLETAEKAGQ